MIPLSTADACDNNSSLLPTGDLRVLPPIFKIYGKKKSFHGPVVTFKAFEHNVSLRGLLETKGHGRVVLIDGGGSTRTAMVGGVLAQLAADMGWAGIVVYGCIRDVDEINVVDIGLRAMASCPRRPAKDGQAELHVPVNICGEVVKDGEWLYADSDGVIVSKTELLDK